MQMMKWSVMALAIAAATTQMAVASSQSESKGFVEDSSFDIFSRALYMNRDYKNGAGNIADSDKASGFKSGYREETGLGIRGLFESGFTEGTVGFGIDAHTLSSIRLDSGRGRTGTGQFSANSDGQAEETQTEVGGAVKARISNSVLKYGNMTIDTPVMSTDDARILPEVATGTLVTSEEIEGLTLTAGRFTALSGQTPTGRDSVGLKSINMGGASYQFTEDFSGAVYASDVEDAFKKQYLNLNYNIAIADDQSLNFDFNGYNTSYEKSYATDADGGKADNKIWSLAAAYTMGAHKFTLARQQSSGDLGYDYGLDGGGAIYLANSVQISDFNGKDEKSWQVRYDLNMASYGVPGLSFMTRYVTADNIDLGVGVEDGKEHEWNFESKYVVQEGAAKDLSFRLRQSSYRANSSYNDAYENDLFDTRLIVEYPLSIL
jgi:imipenem/basic amino acid-specific outer membrane pore